MITLFGYPLEDTTQTPATEELVSPQPDADRDAFDDRDDDGYEWDA